MFEQRLKTIKEKLKEEKLDGLLISSVPNISYLTGYSNFAKEERDGFVLITENGNYILTHSIYSSTLEGKIPNFKVIEISRRDPPEEVIKKLLKKGDSLGIEEHDLSAYEYKKLNAVFKNLKNFDIKVKRSIKDKKEIELISKACQIGDIAFMKVLKKIKLGITEKQLVWELEKFIKEKGFETSFRTIVAFGANAASPHHMSGNTKLENGQFVLMDFGVKFKEYCSDMTRSVVFGKSSQKQKKIYDTVLMAQQKAEDFIEKAIKSGKEIKVSDIDKVARDYIKSEGFPSIPHSLGHGIGLEVHEHPHISPKSKEILREGMVFSIEPGIYIQGVGGVRIEDLYAYENGRLKQLTTSPQNLIELQ